MKELSPEQKKKRNENSRRYRAKHPERLSEQQRRYNAKHREQRAEGLRRYALKHPARVAGYRRKAKYGITPERYQELLGAQHGACAICFRTTALCVDHDHRCCPGKKSCGFCVRGLVCAGCNSMLGLAHDNPRILLSGVAYLEKHA